MSNISGAASFIVVIAAAVVCGGGVAVVVVVVVVVMMLLLVLLLRPLPRQNVPPFEISPAHRCCSFERNAALSPGVPRDVPQINVINAKEEDDERSLGSDMNRTHLSHGSHSTLGVPNPAAYDEWLSHNKLPGSRRLSRSGILGSASAARLYEGQGGFSRRGALGDYPGGLQYDASIDQRDSSSYHGMAPVSNEESNHNLASASASASVSVSASASASAAAGTSSAPQGSSQRTVRTPHQPSATASEPDPVPYVVHSTPMGWKLTTSDRKRFVEAAARMGGYGEHEFLPMPEKLSQLGETMGIPGEFDSVLRSGGSGPSPSRQRPSATAMSRGSSAREKAVERLSKGELKWRGLEHHRRQMKKVDRKMKREVSAANRPKELLEARWAGGGMASRAMTVGGRRTKGRTFRGNVLEDSTGLGVVVGDAGVELHGPLTSSSGAGAAEKQPGERQEEVVRKSFTFAEMFTSESAPEISYESMSKINH